ncbi:hypothetical protein IMZ31_20165 (plasmid) [Pontibacillus sp. ALD_SL1]|uniref:hypothetical protein n=1 Tax=Pontibacillus sp. ALD_SL1 TaxID=2777185 RepID=UPI001A979371|nr:hypothetical protein [Pontibacillus sp. ALD_SL1]QST02867.1 hypothetical protein IMZ31_20165 [Pontibacillus sp. ALD_SL1]
MEEAQTKEFGVEELLKEMLMQTSDQDLLHIVTNEGNGMDGDQIEVAYAESDDQVLID